MLARRAARLALRTASALTSSRELADEVSQDVAVEVLRAIHKLRDENAFDARVHRITVRRASKVLLKGANRRRQELPLALQTTEPESHTPELAELASGDPVGAGRPGNDSVRLQAALREPQIRPGGRSGLRRLTDGACRRRRAIDERLRLRTPAAETAFGSHAHGVRSSPQLGGDGAHRPGACLDHTGWGQGRPRHGLGQTPLDRRPPTVTSGGGSDPCTARAPRHLLAQPSRPPAHLRAPSDLRSAPR